MHIFWANGLLDRWLVYNNLHIKRLIFDPPATSYKSRIFKNLNLREKADRNFRRTFLKNRFRHLKLYSNPPS